MEIHLRYMLRSLQESHRYEKIFLLQLSGSLITMSEAEKSCVRISFKFEELEKHLRNIQSDVLFFNDGHFIEYFYSLRKIFPRSVFIMRSGGNEFVKAPWHDMTLSLSERQKLWSVIINNNIDFIIANSVFTWQRMLNIGIDKAKILIVRGGVDLSSAEKNKADKKLRHEFDKIFGTSERYIFCIAARLVKFKGIIEILKIFNNLKSSQNWFLMIAGEGEEAQTLKQYCEENLPCNCFTFLGALQHEELMKYISLSDCLISCSIDTPRQSGSDIYIHTETMGRTIIEAVCHNVPVIAANSGAVHEWFEELPNIGILLPEDSKERTEIIRSAYENKLICKNNKDLYIYSWEHIAGFFYSELFCKQRRFVEKVLCIDLDNSVIFQFLSHEENSSLLNKILSIAANKANKNKIEVIINSAGDFHEIINRYPVIADNLENLFIISNGGKIIFNHGQPDILWQEYYNMQPGITPQEIADVEKEINSSGFVLIRKKIIDKLYVNFKITGQADKIKQTALLLNSRLKNPSRLVISNSGSIKLISRIINKGSALAYLKNFQLECSFMIGAGDDVLDELFLSYCDKIFIVNSSLQIPDAVNVKIKNLKEAENFIDMLCREILQKNK